VHYAKVIEEVDEDYYPIIKKQAEILLGYLNNARVWNCEELSATIEYCDRKNRKHTVVVSLVTRTQMSQYMLAAENKLHDVNK
jgi:hypothetical protein